MKKRLLTLSKHMFKVSPISSHTDVQPSTLLVNCLIDAAIGCRFRSAMESHNFFKSLFKLLTLQHLSGNLRINFLAP